MFEEEDLVTRFGAVMNPGLARVFRFMGLDGVESHGSGAVIWDEAGHEYLDCAGGYGVFIQGYAHPKIIAAAKRQLEQLALSSRVLLSRPAIELAELLRDVTPGDLQYSFFVNSGTEAVEAALKFARAATGRPRLISTEGAFHGKTLGALTVSGRRTYQAPFEPLLPGVDRVRFGDAEGVAQALGADVAAVIVEPIQGEGGIIVPPSGYLAELRRLTEAAGALLIVDEVQSGMGRTGRLFAFEHEGVVPDLVCLAKALGGGVMPIGAVVGRPHVWQFFEEAPLIHSSTFGGNPLACAVAKAALEVTLDEDLPGRARELGDGFLLPSLQELRAQFPQVLAAVRGRGLMIGLEFRSDGLAGAVMAGLMERRVLAVYTLNNNRVIRLIPPLVITREQLTQVLQALDETLAEVQADAAALADDEG